MMNSLPSLGITLQVADQGLRIIALSNRTFTVRRL